MYLSEVLTPYYSAAKGGNIDLLDPVAVQQNFRTVQSEALSEQTRVNQAMETMNTEVQKLKQQIAVLEGFIKFAVEQRPETMQAYMTMLKAKGVLGLTP